MKPILMMLCAVFLYSFATASPNEADSTINDARMRFAALQETHDPPPADTALTDKIAELEARIAELQTPAPPIEAETPPEAEPTPATEVANAMRRLRPTKDDVLVEIGCGSKAPYCFSAVNYFDVKKAIGIEIDPERAREAREAVENAGLSDRITIITGDALDVDFSEATVGVAYLYPETLNQLRSKILKLNRFVSYMHPVDDLDMKQYGYAYMWTKSVPVRQTQQVAYWNGQAYSGRVCNSPNCRMCNSIQCQLNRTCSTCRRN